MQKYWEIFGGDWDSTWSFFVRAPSARAAVKKWAKQKEADRQRANDVREEHFKQLNRALKKDGKIPIPFVPVPEYKEPFSIQKARFSRFGVLEGYGDILFTERA